MSFSLSEYTKIDVGRAVASPQTPLRELTALPQNSALVVEG